MVIFFWLVLFLFGASLFIGSAVIWYYMAVWEYREPVNLICPETLRPADVKVDGHHAAKTRFAGHEELQVSACSRWPEKRECEQLCTPQVVIAGDDRSRGQYAPFGLQPHSLRVNSPVRMTEQMYLKLAPQFAHDAGEKKG
ncbi:MAG TPA: hypothetical protein VKW78_05400 [Terriglobales bacterium]|nr:hypothetical protein [Terriglobales bacterium]